MANNIEEIYSMEEMVPETEDQENLTTVEELLISCVQARPPLWDSRLSIKERSKTIRDQLWTEIFKEFGENPDFSINYLIKKWRNLRDTYVRLKGEYTPSGSAAKKKKQWEYYDVMSFLNDSIKFRPTVSNLDLLSPSTSNSPTLPIISPTLSEPELTQPKQKTQKIEGAIIDALNKINSVPLDTSGPSTSTVNPICLRISDMLSQMPQKPRTQLEIKLLQVAYEGASNFIE